MVADDKVATILPIKLLKFKKKDGKCPYDKWRKKYSNTSVGAAIDQTLDRVERGKAVKVKSYDGKVCAIVISWPRKIRIYYGINNKNTVILLGGDHFNQTESIQKAKVYWNDYLINEGDIDAKKS